MGFILLIVLVLSFANAANAAESCLHTMARVVSAQGIIELRRAEKTGWEPAIMNTIICAGDKIRTRAHSRAALRLNNESMLRLNQRTTVTFPKTQTDKSKSLLDLINGAIHIITRTPIPFKVRTPFVNANVDGTEFLVSVDEDSTRLVIYEGLVIASNDAGSLRLVDNEAAVIFKDQAPQKSAIIRPTDAVQWALHYPTIIDDLLDPPLQDEQSANYLIHQAGQLLTFGRVDEATINIEQALTLEPDSSDAYALQAIIAVVQNKKNLALNFAMQAVKLNPTSATANLALSYAQQAHFDIEDALATVHETVKLNSQNALVWARLAELQMATGQLDQALDAAQQAVSLNPDIAKTRTVLGFAYLLQINTEDAKTVFNEAILLDQADPMPRLGLGLALIREGDLEAGRIELEIAASLDPANSLIRSYLGKAYFEEKRYSLASTQFDMAKERDPNDPTPWFYDAIQKQTQNRPVEALQDIQKSIELNDNRAVYRSKLLLDQDQAGRGSSLARIYDNLGFEKRALVETAKSLSADPSNHSAHRFLSDIYANIPRHESARVSELLQAQLMQPINVNPVQPQLAVADLNIITGTGPSAAGFNEFSPLMERNRSQLVTSGFAGNNSTYGNEVVFSKLYERTSVSLGQFHYQTNGFRTNNDQNHDILNAFIQHAITPKLNIQAEIRNRTTNQGNLLLDFDRDSNDLTLPQNRIRREINEDVARIGAHYKLTPNQNIILSSQYVNRKDHSKRSFSDSNGNIEFFEKNIGYQTEIQHQLQGNRFNLLAGVGVYRINAQRNDKLVEIFSNNQLPCVNCVSNSFNINRTNGYLYTNLNFYSNLNATIGFSYDAYKEKGLTIDRLNPKLGLQWNIANNLRLRFAWIETIKASLATKQTIEPTQVAGFNQLFDDVNGTKSRRFGIGIDTHYAKRIYSGFEISSRNLSVPLFGSDNNISFENQKENLYRTYIYGLINKNLTIRNEIQFEKFSRPTQHNEPHQIDTLSIPIGVNYFNPQGLFANLTGTFVRQEIDRNGTVDEGIENFFLFDAALGYRLPNRRGIFSLEARNIFDQSFLFRNMNFRVSEPVNVRFVPTRTIFSRITINF